jgi:hypothetical protein
MLMVFAKKPAVPVVSLGSLTVQELGIQWHSDLLERVRVENHIRRRLQALGVHIVSPNIPLDVGTCQAEWQGPHLDFDVRVMHAPIRVGSWPLVLINRMGRPNTPSDPGAWLLVPDSEDAIEVAEMWARDHPWETPFTIIRWKGLAELTKALRGVVFPHFQ